MRVAVHTITKDETQHLERWAQSAAEADLLAICDTGSTDSTPELAADLGIQVTHAVVKPFRFDTARNAGLAQLPADLDVVITLDLDEVLVEGWRDQLEAGWAANPWATRWTYTYVWSWVAPGAPDVQFTADRTHSRGGWRWVGAVHEVLAPTAPAWDQPAAPAGFTIEHHPDDTKSRSDYLPLLKQAVAEEPHNPRQHFYLGREFYFYGHWHQARETFTRFLGMPEATWPAERAEAYRYLAKMDDHPERWLLKAVAEDPGRRDALVDLVDLYEGWGWHAEARGMAARAMRITERTGDYMTTARTWDDQHLWEVLTSEHTSS